MTRNELTDMILDTKKSLSFYENITTSCSHCEHLVGDASACRKYGPVPQEYVSQPNECADWSFDDVPF